MYVVSSMYVKSTRRQLTIKNLSCARATSRVNINIKVKDVTTVFARYIIGYKILRIITILHQPHTRNYTRMICNSIFSTLIHAYYRYLPSKITMMKCMHVRTCRQFRHLSRKSNTPDSRLH